MRVLFDIVHPADVLFFLNPIRALEERGDVVRIASREKDVATNLLDHFGLAHQPLSRHGAGTLGLARELVMRDVAMLRLIREFRPQVMVGLGGISIAHAGWLTRRPSLSFYAADTARLQTRLTWPFITHLYVPDAYAGTIPQGRTTRFAGIKELSYFHPDNFRVDDDTARRNGWQEDVKNFFVRTVSWSANHDIGKRGWSDAELSSLIEYLAARGKVHISSERPLPPHLSHHAYTGAKHLLHHLLGKCALYVGESATMAHEAALLGVPAIYDGADHPGTTRELMRHGLLIALRQPGLDTLLAQVESELLPSGVAEREARRRAYLDERGNLADYIVAAIDRHALPE